MVFFCVEVLGLGFAPVGEGLAGVGRDGRDGVGCGAGVGAGVGATVGAGAEVGVGAEVEAGAVAEVFKFGIELNEKVTVESALGSGNAVGSGKTRRASGADGAAPAT